MSVDVVYLVWAPLGPAPLERFLVMTGLERGVPLRPGERYKIVVE